MFLLSKKAILPQVWILFFIFASCKQRSELQGIQPTTEGPKNLYFPVTLEDDFARSLEGSGFKLSDTTCLRRAMSLSAGTEKLLVFSFSCKELDQIMKDGREPPASMEFFVLPPSSSQGGIEKGSLIAKTDQIHAAVGVWSRKADDPKTISLDHLCWKQHDQACELSPSANGAWDEIRVRRDGTVRSPLVRMGQPAFLRIRMYESYLHKRSFNAKAPYCSLVIDALHLEGDQLRLRLLRTETTVRPNCEQRGRIIDVTCKDRNAVRCEITGTRDPVDFDVLTQRILIYNDALKEMAYYQLDPPTVKFVSDVAEQ